MQVKLKFTKQIKIIYMNSKLSLICLFYVKYLYVIAVPTLVMFQFMCNNWVVLVNFLLQTKIEEGKDKYLSKF